MYLLTTCPGLWRDKIEPNLKAGEAGHYVQKKKFMQHSNNSTLDDPDNKNYEPSEEG